MEELDFSTVEFEEIPADQLTDFYGNYSSKPSLMQRLKQQMASQGQMPAGSNYITREEVMQLLQKKVVAGGGYPAGLDEREPIERTLAVLTENQNVGFDGWHGVSVGPVTLAPGVTVTVEPGYVWSIV